MSNPRPALGEYIRNEVIPSGMTVSEAAAQLNVTRATLSRLLNGRIPLSAKMANRLVQVFGADSKRLLDFRTKLDYRPQRHTSPPVARRVMPSFGARQIERWSEYNEASTRLATFLRLLIYSTVADSFQFILPKNEHSKHRGWHGALDAGTISTWIPDGKSRWVFSTDKNVAVKADEDYLGLSDSTSHSESAEFAFVFVTTRIWPGKFQWKKDREAEGKWRKVEALDASDLEQWLNTSVSAQVWFAEQFGMETEGLETLDEAWRRWVNIGSKNIELSTELFKHSVSMYLNKFKFFIEHKRRRPVLSIAADSTDEALAFLYCLFNEIDDYSENRQHVLIVSDPKPLIRIKRSLSPQTVLIACTPEAQNVLGFPSQNPRIVITPRNTKSLMLDLDVFINQIEFTAALRKMGAKNNNEIERYVRETGCSPTVLRRVISDNPAICSPEWASGDNAHALIPLALIGVWNKNSPSDRMFVSKLANQEYSNIESTIAELLRLEDSPVWSEGRFCGVISKKDALFSIAENVSRTNIMDFIKYSKDLLSKNTNTTEDHFRLPPHSDELNRSVCDSLVLLAVNGNQLFQNRLDVDIEHNVKKLIHSLLTPLTHEKLLAHDSKLQSYADAAPQEFLNIIEVELKESNLLSSQPLTHGLLGALERLAWQNLDRVISILAKLSQLEIESDSMERLVESLSRIYCSWRPQTNATLDRRINNFKLLAKNSPDTARRLLIAIIAQTTIAEPNYFSWRNETLGVRKEISIEARNEFMRAALDVVLSMDLSCEALGSLVKHLTAMENEYQQRVWELIDLWEKNATEADKAYLREQIRQHTLIEISDRARKAYEKLKPQDLILRYLWLFQEEDVLLTLDENPDYSENEIWLYTNRVDALKEILKKKGIEGIIALLERSDNPYAVGKATASFISEADAQLNIMREFLAVDSNYGKKGLEGFLRSTEPAAFFLLLKEFEHEQQLNLLQSAPFESETWRMLDQLEPNIKREYWQNVQPKFCFRSADLKEAAESFLAVNRPLEAFNTVIDQWEEIETPLLKSILFAVAKGNHDPEKNRYRFRYHLEDAIKSLGEHYSLADNQLAFLEFSFLNIYTRRIPCLEHKIAMEPHWFAKAIVNRYLGEDGRQEKLWEYYDAALSSQKTTRKIRLMFEKIRRIPGTDDNGIFDAMQLQMWIKKVQELFYENSKLRQAADRVIGNLLSKAPVGQEGEWPDFAVSEAMEQCQSPDLALSFRRNVRYRRDFRSIMRNESEEHIVNKLREWVKQQKKNDNFFVARILEKIAQDYEEDSIGTYDRRADIYNRSRRW